MGQDNDVPRRINGVEGAAGDVMVSGGPGVCESWGGVVVPSGLIAMWHGTIANIPAGWVVCDGNNSTPNLLGRFVESVPNVATDPGATGGATNKTTAGHYHSLNEESQTQNQYYILNEEGSNLKHDRWQAGSGSGDQQLKADTDSKTDSIADIRPQYYDVAFIMKT